MAIYKFTEVDNTRVSTVKNDNSNYVFLPINSTWGPSDKPVAILSLAELKEYFGEDAEVNSGNTTITSYQYATDIIKSGFCVLALRVMTSTPNEDAAKAATQKEYKKFHLNYHSETSNKRLEVEIGTYDERVVGSEEATKTFYRQDTSEVFWYHPEDSEKIPGPYDDIKFDFTIKTAEQDKNKYTMTFDGQHYILTYIGETRETTPSSINAYFTASIIYPDGIEAIYEGTYGNGLKSNLLMKPYGVNKKLLILSTRNTASNYTLEETPLGLINVATDEFTPADSVVSDYIKIKNINVGIVTSSDEDTNTDVELDYGTDVGRSSAISQAISIYSATDNELANKWLYDIKFLCNGGLIDTNSENEESVVSLAAGMIQIAESRQDCVAFIDSPKYNSPDDTKVFFRDRITNKSSYAAAYAPWCKGTVIGSSSVVDIPASYYVITSIAKSFSAGNNVCLPPAGVNRGSVNIKQPAFNIGNRTMEEWQGNTGDLTFCINPIMNVRKYGYCIFGQRNLYELPYGLSSALQELGVRLTLNEVKKWVRDVAISLTFESNTNRTWNEFVSKVQKCLDKLVADGLLTQYSIERNSDITDQINTNTLSATIRVYVTRALENFDITVEVNSGDITFDEAYTG